MTYTRNFGFRSFENIVRSARFRAPAAGTLTIGEPVILDTANAGRMKAATAGVANGSSSGVVLYERIQSTGVDPLLVGAGDFSTVPIGQYAQIVHGLGVKIWLKQTAAKTLYDGRVQAAYNPFAASVDLSALAIGAQLTPDGAGKWKVSNGTTDGDWLTVESVNATTKTVEARFNF